MIMLEEINSTAEQITYSVYDYFENESKKHKGRLQ